MHPTGTEAHRSDTARAAASDPAMPRTGGTSTSRPSTSRTSTSRTSTSRTSRLGAARAALARAVTAVQLERDWHPARRREALEPYVLDYAVAFADARSSAIGPSADRAEMRQLARRRALATLERLDGNLSAGEQLSYLHTALTGAFADVARAADVLGRAGRHLHQRFVDLVDAATQEQHRELTPAELDAIATAIAGADARPADWYRCRYGTDPVVAHPTYFGLGDTRSDAADPERAVLGAELVRAVAIHPEPEIRRYLLWALTGEVEQAPTPGSGRHSRTSRVERNGTEEASSRHGCQGRNPSPPRPDAILERLGPQLRDLLGLEPSGLELSGLEPSDLGPSGLGPSGLG